MKSLKQLGTALLALLLTSTVIHAQNKYQVQFRGTCVSTNEAGDLVKQTITHNTLIQECIADVGATNRPNLKLVYHENADFNGDIIEVIGSRTGQVFCQKLRLLFPMTIAGNDASEVYQLVYVFSPSGTDPVGQGFVTKKTKNNKTRISGDLIYHLPAEGTNALRICNTSFNTSKLVTIQD